MENENMTDDKFFDELDQREKAMHNALTKPKYGAATMHMALFTADPTDTGSLPDEASGHDYARVAIGQAE